MVMNLLDYPHGRWLSSDPTGGDVTNPQRVATLSAFLSVGF